MRFIAIALFCCALITACSEKQKTEEKSVKTPDFIVNTAIGGPFELVNQEGQTVTEKDFSGRPLLVYFGYAYCPDICPTSLQVMAAALEDLGQDKDRFQPVFISVDPERDTPQFLKTYVTSNGFPENLTGLTGTPEQIKSVAQAYKVYYQKEKTPESAAGYLMDHSSIIYLMDEQGRNIAIFTHGTSPDQITKTLRRFLKLHPQKPVSP